MRRIIAILILMILVAGCTSIEIPIFQPVSFQMKDDSEATQEGVQATIEANNRFAFDLYNELEEDSGNVFFSPYSISTALSMTYEGGRGKTAEEMANVFHFSEDDSVRRPSFARIYNQINKPNEDYQLSTANAIWAQQDYPFLEEYFGVIEDYYGGEINNMDFSKSKECTDTINGWVEEKTNDKIKDLIPDGVIDSTTRLVLTNAIYFKGIWVDQFDKDDTYDDDFKISEQETVKVSMMSMRNQEFNYIETDELKMLELPYEGDKLSMLILLPKDDIESLETTAEKLDEWKDMLTKTELNLIQIPKFKFETKYFMKDVLIKMGMPTAFSGEADFSGMTGNGDLVIDNVIHQAFVEVNEEGTEAAAATAVIMRETSAGDFVSFRANRPFIFIIQERNDGNILFMGRVADPR